MELGSLLVLLVVLACPLMMVWMMRGGHGGHGHGPHDPEAGHRQPAGGESPVGHSLDQLRARRAELDSEIALLEDEGAESKTPTAV